MNPRLALALNKAKKSAVPKASIEAAIARGQGLSPSGVALESVTLEAMLPPSIAVVIESQTDSKLRLLADLRLIVKESGGNVSTVDYMFEKKGRIIFRPKEGVGADEVLEHALEEDVLGVIDVIEDDVGRVVMFTEPAQTQKTAEKIVKILELEIEDTEIIWDPNEDTKVPVDDEETANRLSDFVDEVQEVMGVQGIYVNWSKGAISDETWANLQSKISA
jgi:transcriptional/translational regulatory protein YebC/TACO1